MPNREQRWRQKVRALFAELSPIQLLDENIPPRLERSLRQDHSSKKSYDIAFHLSDWRMEAAFLVAVQLDPSRFTPRDIREAVTACLIHIPNHIAAAATLADWEMRDIFELGAKIKPARRLRRRR